MSYTRLTYKQRLIIEQGLFSGASQSAIARKIGVHRSTVSNELQRNGKGCYSAKSAQKQAEKNSKRIRTPQGCFTDRFPLNRGGRFKGLYIRSLKRPPRAWRLRFYTPVVRLYQNRFQWNLTFQTKLHRRRYLHHRKRNHGLEACGRSFRDLSVFESYRKSMRFKKRRGRCYTPYYRFYTLSHEGIIKGHYGFRLLSRAGLNKHRSPWRGHIRYEFQNLVRRKPKVPEVKSTYTAGLTGFLSHFKSTFNKAWNFQEVFCGLCYGYGLDFYDGYCYNNLGLLEGPGVELQDIAIQLRR